MTAPAVMLLADPQDAGKAGPLGLLAIIVLGVACYFLFKSMSRHLKKVREDFPDQDADMRAAEPTPHDPTSTPDPGRVTPTSVVPPRTAEPPPPPVSRNPR